MLASLRAYPRPGMSTVDVAQDKAKARELFDRVVKDVELEATRSGGKLSGGSRAVAEDIEMFVEVARLWQADSLERMDRALKEALRISEAVGQVDPRLINNVGVLQHLEGNYAVARSSYERALMQATTLNSETAEGLSTTVLYNLARVYEDEGEELLAKGAYEKLLSRHPEYIDGKSRKRNAFTLLTCL